jgi:hypothetical protein
MKVAKGWHQISVAQFQELLPIYKKALTEEDSVKWLSHWSNIIAILADCQTDEVEALPLDEVNRIIKSLSWLNDKHLPHPKRRFLLIKGRLYKATTEAKKFNTAQYVEYKTFIGRGNLISEMHYLLATIYHPVWGDKSHEEKAAMFRQMPVSKVYPMVFFYTKVYMTSIKRIEEYGTRLMKEELKKADEALMLTLREILENIGDGTQSSTNSRGETRLRRTKSISGE